MEDFTSLAERFTPMIYSIIQRLSIYKNKEEFYQIGLVGLWEASQKYDENIGTFHTFAYKIIQGRILNHLRKESRYENHYTATQTDEIIESPVLSGRDNPLQKEMILTYCETLTPSQTNWLLAAFIEQQSIQEIADRYEVSAAAVKSWRKSALNKLRKEIHLHH